MDLWILLILGCISLFAAFFFFPETLRALVGNGLGYANPTPAQWIARRRGKIDDENIAQVKATVDPHPEMNFLSPFLFSEEPDVFLVLWYNDVVFVSFYCIMVSTTKQFCTHYPHISELEIGVFFLCMGVGAVIGSIIRGRILGRDYCITYNKFKEQNPDKKPDSEFPCSF